MILHCHKTGTDKGPKKITKWLKFVLYGIREHIAIESRILGGTAN